MTQNPKLKAVVSIRNLVLGLSNDWKELKSLGAEIDESVHNASTKFINQAPIAAHERWLTEMGKMEENIHSLKNIMNQSVKKINNRESEGLAEIWNSHTKFSTDLLDRLNTLFELGKTHLPEGYQSSWTKNW